LWLSALPTVPLPRADQFGISRHQMPEPMPQVSRMEAGTGKGNDEQDSFERRA